VNRGRLLVIVAVIGAAAVLIISRLDLGAAIKEVTLPLRHDDIIRQQAADKNLDPALIAAVINVESGFDQHARSGADARGLMQVTPDTAQGIANESGGVAFTVSDLEDPQINISYGSFHLRQLLDQYDQNLIAALAAYNAGSGNVDQWGGSSLGLSDIQFPETRAYVEQVLEKRQQYRDNYAADLGL
jgi:soluble lytic murein transglycosylase